MIVSLVADLVIVGFLAAIAFGVVTAPVSRWGVGVRITAGVLAFVGIAAPLTVLMWMS